MANPYSEDLREKAIGLLDDGRSVYEVEKLLGIGKSSLYLWLKRRREAGTIASKKDWRKGHSHKIKDLETFKKFVHENQGLTALAMAEKWGDISPKTVCKWLHRIGFTRKKRSTDTKSGVKRSVKFIWTR